MFLKGLTSRSRQTTKSLPGHFMFSTLRFGKTWLFVSLVLFSQVGELPLFHEHEHEHLCVDLKGDHYYLNQDPYLGETSGPVLLNMRLGDQHKHHQCAVCRLASALLISTPETLYFAHAVQSFNADPIDRFNSRLTGIRGGRGPPQNV